MLNDPRSANGRQANHLVALDAGPLGHVGQDRGNPKVETVPAGEDPLSLRNGRRRCIACRIYGLGNGLAARKKGEESGHSAKVKTKSIAI
jgi:hypothetical protein